MSWAARLFKAAFITATLVLWPLTFFLTFDKAYMSKLPQTIFAFDYQARQQVIRNSYAYPNVFLARLFQNKAMIPIGKFEHNLTALLDPNNYFFGFHPREIVSGNQNAVKFPFVALPIFLVGLYLAAGDKSGRKVLFSFIFLAIALSLLANFDRYDFLLFFPLIYLFFKGLAKIPSLYFVLAFPLALIEVARQITIFFPR